MASELADAARPSGTGQRRPRRAGPFALSVGLAVLLFGGWTAAGAATVPDVAPTPQVEPTANLTVSPNPVEPGETVLLDATDSSGGDADVVACEFDVDGDGEIDVQNQDCLAEWTYEAAGEYTATVRVLTGADENATATEVVVVGDNRPPVPVVGFEPAEPHPGETVTLSAEGSSDPDGRIVRTVWRLPDRRFEGEAVRTTFSEAREYDVTLEVVDDDGLGNETSRTLVVSENSPPEAALALATDDPRAGEPVEFDATDSTDVDGRVVEFRWDFDGDGEVDRVTETGRTTVSVDESGRRTVTVTVADDDGGTASSSLAVDVAPAATRDETATTRETASPVTGSDGSGAAPFAAFDFGLAPLVPDWLAVLLLVVAVAGVGTAWRRREAVRTRIEGLRSRLGRGDVRRRAAKKASGAVTKTAAKRVLRTVADGIEGGGRGVGEVFERLGRAIKRWSGRVAAALRRLAG